MSDQGTKSPAKLPRLLRRFFWDYDFDALSWERDRDFVTGRLTYLLAWKRHQLQSHGHYLRRTEYTS